MLSNNNNYVLIKNFICNIIHNIFLLNYEIKFKLIIFVNCYIVLIDNISYLDFLLFLYN